LRPGVLVVHDWMGVGDFTRGRADELARMGYVAFAADVYGKGIRPKNSEDASKQAAIYKGNRPLFRSRMRAAFDSLIKQSHVDPARTAAIGYCFGGTAVLELARSGAPLKGVVSIHGGLDSPTPGDAKNIKGRILALHGADDPYVPSDQVTAFEKEMREGGVDWELVKFGDAVHAFSIPGAGHDKSKGAAYNPVVASRAWQAMADFLEDIFR
jgi:dienelactone hydrolase